MTKNKCKNCDHREVGCHSTCPDYLAWKAEREDVKEKRRKDATLNANFYNFKMEQVKKFKKNRR